MAFEIDHDWEGNLATPTARIGEKAKIRLLILLCAIWVLLGLIGHHPWKPEAESISIIHGLFNHGNVLLLHASSDQQLSHPPLYYLVAAGFAKLFNGWLSIHDAARLSNAVWMSLTLLLAGMIGRELWGIGVGRQTTFILMSCIGLISGTHLLMPAVAGLTGL
ncbi:MAG: ArnT family glycosyltransferase, partial [Methylophilaceae bacterium]